MTKRGCAFIILMALLWPGTALGMDAALENSLSQLDLDGLTQAARDSAWLSGGIPEALGKLCQGQSVLSPTEALNLILQQAAGIFRSSLWRMTRLMAPALLLSALESVKPSGAGRAARYAGLAMALAFLVADLREHAALVSDTVSRMSGWMQALFPLLVTLLAAVGGTASSAFYQPAVMAAAGTMTTLIQHVTMPLAVSVAVLTMVGGLSDSLRAGRMCRLFRQAANWTLGLGFTVFIGVMTVQGLGAAALDGVSIRTAKYAMDHFIPIVGGMFADTVDTLVGCSLVIENALGALGLLVLLGILITPLLRLVMTLFLYRAAAALLEPMGDTPLCRAIGDYADVFSLLLIIQMSVGAMFLLLTAQVVGVGNATVMLR